MTKISQCSHCRIGKAIHCKFFRPVDDNPCPHFRPGIDDEKESSFSAYWQLAFFLYVFILWLLNLHYGSSVFAYGLALSVLAVGIWLLGGIGLHIRDSRRCGRLYGRIERILILLGVPSSGIERQNRCFRFSYRNALFFLELENASEAVLYDLCWFDLPPGKAALAESSFRPMETLAPSSGLVRVAISPMKDDDGTERSCLTSSARLSLSSKEGDEKEAELLRSLLDEMLDVRQKALRSFLSGNTSLSC